MAERLVATIPEAARALQVSVPTAYRLVASGMLPTVRLGPRLTRVPLDVLRAQLAAASTPGQPGAPPSIVPGALAR
jgi:excisionase family DNA binding protein